MSDSAAIQATETASAACPECGKEIDIPPQVAICYILNCSMCAAELEVVGLDPIDLALAPEVEEDWGE